MLTFLSTQTTPITKNIWNGCLKATHQNLLSHQSQTNMATINETEARLNSHEAVCALRYEQINARLKRIENIMLKTAGIMILGMGGTIFSAVWILK